MFYSQSRNKGRFLSSRSTRIRSVPFVLGAVLLSVPSYADSDSSSLLNSPSDLTCESLTIRNEGGKPDLDVLCKDARGRFLNRTLTQNEKKCVLRQAGELSSFISNPRYSSFLNENHLSRVILDFKERMDADSLERGASLSAVRVYKSSNVSGKENITKYEVLNKNADFTQKGQWRSAAGFGPKGNYYFKSVERCKGANCYRTHSDDYERPEGYQIVGLKDVPGNVQSCDEGYYFGCLVKIFLEPGRPLPQDKQFLKQRRFDRFFFYPNANGMHGTYISDGFSRKEVALFIRFGLNEDGRCVGVSREDLVDYVERQIQEKDRIRSLEKNVDELNRVLASFGEQDSESLSFVTQNTEKKVEDDGEVSRGFGPLYAAPGRPGAHIAK